MVRIRDAGLRSSQEGVEDYLQKPGPECGYHDRFGRPRHLQVFHQKDRDEEEGDIGGDVNCTDGLPALKLKGERIGESG